MQYHTHKKIYAAPAAVMSAVLAIASGGVLSACGSTSHSSTVATRAASSPPAATHAASSTPAAFTKLVDTIVHQNNSPLPNRPPPTGPAAVKNKTIAVVITSGQGAGAVRIADGIKQATKAIGWKFVEFDGMGQASVQAADVQKAIAEKVNAIVMVAIDDSTVMAPLRQARAAGIIVAGAFSGNKSGVYQFEIPSPAATEQGSYVMGAVAYKLTGGKLAGVETMDPEYQLGFDRQAGWNKFIAQCKAAGGNCKTLARQNFLIANFAQLPAQASALLQQNPGWNVVWSLFDAQLTQEESGIKASGSAGAGALGVGQDGDANIIHQIQTHGFAQATVALPGTWMGFATVDDLNRLFAHQTALSTAQEGVALKVLDPQDVSSIARDGVWNGDYNPVPDYERIWTGKAK